MKGALKRNTRIYQGYKEILTEIGMLGYIGQAADGPGW
jgi:hypothetical protein